MEQPVLRAFVLVAGPAFVGIVILAGGIGLWRLRLRAARTRAAGVALAIGLLLGLATAGVVDIFIAELSSFDTTTTPGHFVAAAPFAALAGALVFLVSVAGSALGQLKGDGWQLVGSVVGPILFVGTAFGLMSLSIEATSRLHALEQMTEAAEVTARSSSLSAEVVEVQAVLDSSADPPIVTRLQLRVELTSADGLRLESGKVVWPRFTADAGGAALPLSADAPAGSPQQLEPGSTTEYAVTFDLPPTVRDGLGTYEPASPGRWNLVVDMVGADGEARQASTTFVVDASASLLPSTTR